MAAEPAACWSLSLGWEGGCTPVWAGDVGVEGSGCVGETNLLTPFAGVSPPVMTPLFCGDFLHGQYYDLPLLGGGGGEGQRLRREMGN